MHQMSQLLRRTFSRPESITVLILIAAFVVSAMLSEYFLDARFLLDSTSLYMEIGVLALAMTLIIISGNIDLSVASGLALVGVVAGVLHLRVGMPMGAVIPLSIITGMLLGLFNGLLVARLGLPSLTVTLGTLALYRGVAHILVGEHSLGGFPEWFVGLDYRWIGGVVPMPLVIFLVVAVLFALVLHGTTFGRCVYALGTNEAAARFSGIRVGMVKTAVFVIAGLMMGIAAMMMTSRLGVARYDSAFGGELLVITAVVLGGTDIFGGRGSIFGTVMALLLLGLLQRGMGVANITAEKQLAVTGTLLVAAVIVTNLMGRLGPGRNAARSAPPPGFAIETQGDPNHA
jgi:rhamnose transport system permease protein